MAPNGGDFCKSNVALMNYESVLKKRNLAELQNFEFKFNGTRTVLNFYD